MHIIIDLIKDNDSFLRIQGIVNEYGCSCFTNYILQISE